MLSRAWLGVSQVMQPPVSHGRLFLIKLMQTFPDTLPKQAVAHTHPVTPADPPLGLSGSTSLLGVHTHHVPADSHSHVFPASPSGQAPFYSMVVVTPDPRQEIALFILGALGLLGRSWIPQKSCKGEYSGRVFVDSQARDLEKWACE